ncbi:hypothetical protein PENSPDRAFT_739156 [Peniophora sp. CONT]|nr:hypothetical protein PENSPDRAFT_739156 [Peniophora sp. CONT]
MPGGGISKFIGRRRRRDRRSTAQDSSTAEPNASSGYVGSAARGGQPAAHDPRGSTHNASYMGRGTPGHRQTRGYTTGHNTPAAAGPGPATAAHWRARGSGHVPSSSHGHGSSGSSSSSGFTTFGSGHHGSGSSHATTMNDQFWGHNIQPPPHSPIGSIATFSAGSGSGSGSGHQSGSNHRSGSGHHSSSQSRIGSHSHSSSHSRSGFGSGSARGGRVSGRGGLFGRRRGHGAPSSSLPNIAESSHEHRDERYTHSWS